MKHHFITASLYQKEEEEEEERKTEGRDEFDDDDEAGRERARLCCWWWCVAIITGKERNSKPHKVSNEKRLRKREMMEAVSTMYIYTNTSP